MTDIIKHDFFFPHSPEAVWEYLTNADLMELWLMKNNFQLIVGHDFQFRTKAIPQLDFDGIAYCKVLEIVPFKKLCYSWKSGPGEGRVTLDSIVVWQLEPRDNGTQLSLVHSGFSSIVNLALFDAMDNGWLQNIHKIAHRLNDAKNGTTNT